MKAAFTSIGVAALLLLPLPQNQTYAQSEFGKVFQARFGIAGGINRTGLTEVTIGGITADYEPKQGWHAGLFVDGSFLFLGVRLGAYYTNAGKLFSDDALTGLPGAARASELTDFDVTYISIPLDARIGIPLPALMPYLLIGPELKINMVSDDKGELARQLESTAFAGNVGLGVAINLGKIKLYPEVRVVFGLSGILGETITIGGEQYSVETHVENGLVGRLGIAI